jgi:hypothetical protein
VRSARHLPSRDRLSVLTAVIILAYTLSRLLDFPTRLIGVTVFGSPLGVELNGRGLMLVLVAALISAGADTLIRSHPAFESRSRPTVIHWILPAAAALVLGGALNLAPDGPVWWLGLGLSAVALLVVLVAEYVVVDRADPAWELAALGLAAAAYALALLGFTVLYGLGARAAISATLGGLLAAALALRLFRLRAVEGARASLYAGVVGLITAEALWAVSYWRITPVSAGLLAMIPFYLAAGLAQQHLAGRLTRRLWIEYGLVGALALLIAALYGLAQG